MTTTDTFSISKKQVSAWLNLLCLSGGGVLLYLGTDSVMISVGAGLLAVFARPDA